MKKNKLFAYLLVSLIAVSACTGKYVYHSTRSVMPNTTPEMNLPGYWISLTENTDKIVMDPKQIETLNSKIIEQNLRIDVPNMSMYFSKIALTGILEKSFRELEGRKFFFKNGSRVSDRYFERIKINANLSEILYDGVNKYAFIIQTAQQRSIPVKESLLTNPFLPENDIIQKCTLDIGTPVAVQHESMDKRWYFVVSPYTYGWVEAEKMVMCEKDDTTFYTTKAPFLVVTKAKTGIYLDPERTKFYGFARMGCRFPVNSKTDTAICIGIPFKTLTGELAFGAAYIDKSATHEGYLDYTPRNIINQAFELLNEPYGAEEFGAALDNTKFIEQIFLTVGLRFPRNVSYLSLIGTTVEIPKRMSSQKDKMMNIAKISHGGITLFFTDETAMLYLGLSNGKLYCIHEFLDYEEKLGGRKATTPIKRAVVTDLILGKKTSKDSLFEKIKSIKIVN